VAGERCPVCAHVVPALGWIPPREATNGHGRQRGAVNLPVESRTCPECGTPLEREAPGSWRRAGSSPGTDDAPRQRFSRPQ